MIYLDFRNFEILFFYRDPNTAQQTVFYFQFLGLPTMKFQLMMAHGKSRRVPASICVLAQDQRPGE